MTNFEEKSTPINIFIRFTVQKLKKFFLTLHRKSATAQNLHLK